MSILAGVLIGVASAGFIGMAFAGRKIHSYNMKIISYRQQIRLYEKMEVEELETKVTELSDSIVRGEK